ncbi:MAG: T9SS type A sorting domain-containing protein, partial [Flavobacteriales bacterium]
IQVKLWPNPATSMLKFKLTPTTQSLVTSEKIQLDIYGFDGRIIYREEVASEGEINTHGWSSGVYCAQFSLKETQVKRKILIQ